MALSLDGTTGISASGNIVGNNIIVSGSLTAGTFSPASLSASGNVTGGNLVTAGLITATGNITTAGVITATGNIQGGNILTTGLISATSTVTAAANISGGNLLTGGLISATGNITGGNVLGGANINATTHTGTTVSVTGNIDGGNLRTGGLITATGNITGGNLSVSTGTVSVGNIVNTNANGVGNIGSPSLYFNVVHARATSAQYADLAEMYQADKQLDAGQVVEFGGPAEIQKTSTSHSCRIAGIVSSNPSYIMNAGMDLPNKTAVALTGRVPCYVIGMIRKGDRLVSSDIPGVATALDIDRYEPGCIIGKAIEDYESQEIGRIEVAVGRF